MSDISTITATLATAITAGRQPQRILSHLRPIWRVTVKGQDISSRIQPRLVSLTITDNRDGEADEVEIVISDHDGAVELPETGDTLTVAIGWAVSPSSGLYRAVTQAEVGDFPLGLIDKGTYSIQAVEYSGSPDTITLRARAAIPRKEAEIELQPGWAGQQLVDKGTFVVAEAEYGGAPDKVTMRVICQSWPCANGASCPDQSAQPSRPRCAPCATP